MRKIFMLTCMALLLFTSCSRNEAVPSRPDGSISATSSQSSVKKLFTTEYIPVACSHGRFIVRNESGNLYGLVDENGKTLMPCEFEKISFEQGKTSTVLSVLDKGFYGVYSLDGKEIVPCEFTSIRFSIYYDSCIVKTFLQKYGLIAFSGSYILPAEYDNVAFGYGKIIAASKLANEKASGLIAAYSPEGRLIKELSTNLWDSAIYFYNGDNIVEYIDPSTNYSNYSTLKLISEGSNVLSNSQAVGNHVFYFQANELILRDRMTLQEAVVWKFPDGRNSKRTDIRSLTSSIDPVSGCEFIDIFLVGFFDDTPNGEGYNVRVTLGENFSAFGYKAYDMDWSSISDLNNGVSIVFPSQGYIYTINSNGEKVKELPNPYTDRYTSYVLKNAVILNNNGFYTVIDADGNTLLSKEGYSDVTRLNIRGAYLVTDHNGAMGIINDYAQVLVPCGSVTSIESLFERLNYYNKWDIEATYNADDDLYIIHNGDMWAVYNEKTHKLCTEFKGLGDEHLNQYNQVLGYEGFILIDEECENAYLIVKADNTYSVTAYFTL